MGSGSLLALIEYQVDYAVRVARKLQREGLKSITVKKAAVEDYDEYIEVSSSCPTKKLPANLGVSITSLRYDCSVTIYITHVS